MNTMLIGNETMHIGNLEEKMLKKEGIINFKINNMRVHSVLLAQHGKVCGH